MSDQRSTQVYYTARPRVILEGKYDQELTDGLLTLLVEENTEGLFCCEVTFSDRRTNGTGEYLYLDREVLDFGKSIAIQAGKTEEKIFEGRITALEGHYHQLYQAITVLAEDRFQDLRMTRRTRTFEEVTFNDVILQIASQHSLIAEVDIDGPSYSVLAQVNQSDLSFIRERALAVDAEVWVKGKILYASSRSSRNAGTVTLTRQKGLREFSVVADLSNQRTSLVVSGWDAAAKDSIEFEASESAINAELHGNKGGSNLLLSSFGKRAEQIVHMVPLTDLEARHLAEAKYRKIARRFVTGYGVAEGNGGIRVGTRVDLKDLGKMFEGTYYVTEVRHTFDMQNGYQTHFAVERPGIGVV
jgi:phage protein D